jgi:integrase
MQLFKRGDIWWGRWSVDGTQVRHSSKTSDERLAREYLAKKFGESYRETRLSEKKRRTWAEASARYIEEHQHLRTVAQYTVQAAWWTEQFKVEKVVFLDDISPDLVKKIRDAEYRRPKQRGGERRTPAAVNRKIAFLRCVMNAAYREYRWFGPGEESPLFRFIPGEVERSRYLKPDEVLRLARHLPEPYGAMARMAAATGLRRANILRMKWEQVQFGTRSLLLPGTVMKNGSVLRVPLSGMALEILREQFGKSDVHVFPKPDGKPAAEIPSKVWAAAIKNAGLDDVRWHDLRHTWASQLRQQGLGLEVIQELGGWKDSRMVKRYSHLNIDHLHEAAALIDRAFGRASTNLAQPSELSAEKYSASA